MLCLAWLQELAHSWAYVCFMRVTRVYSIVAQALNCFVLETSRNPNFRKSWKRIVTLWLPRTAESTIAESFDRYAIYIYRYCNTIDIISYIYNISLGSIVKTPYQSAISDFTPPVNLGHSQVKHAKLMTSKRSVKPQSGVQEWCVPWRFSIHQHTVDGWNPWYGKYPIIHRVTSINSTIHQQKNMPCGSHSPRSLIPIWFFMSGYSCRAQPEASYSTCSSFRVGKSRFRMTEGHTVFV